MIWPGESGVGIGIDSRIGRNNRCKFDESEIGDGEIDSSKVGENKIGKKGQKTSKFKNSSKFQKSFKFKKTIRLNFFTLGVRLVFTKLRQAFIKAPIFHHFDLKHHIQVETDVSGYAIDRVLSQLTLDNLGQ